MTVPSNEPVVPNEEAPVVNDGQAEEIKGHPAWEEILNVIPADFQALVKPTLEKWDKGVADRLQEVRAEYDPYKPFIENKVDPEFINEALGLAQAFQTDPEKIVSDAIEAFGLDYVLKAAEESQQTTDLPNDSDDDEGLVDLTKHPEFIRMQEVINNLTSKEEQEKASKEEAKALEEHQKELDALKETHGEFDDMIVTTLMVNGLDGESAVKQYFDTINQAAAKLAGNNAPPEAPIVMGGGGATGSGIPNEPVKLGKLSSKDTVALAMEMINRDKQAST